MAQTALARERLFALRETIARLEGKPAPALAAAEREALAEGRKRRQECMLPHLPFGVEALDEALEGGLQLDAITEFRAASSGDAGTASGLAMAIAARLQKHEEDTGRLLPLLWIGDAVGTLEAGRPYAPGLKDFGLKPERFFHAAPRKLEDALWLAEAAIESAAFSVVVFEVRGNPLHFGLTESRRLSLRARAVRRPLFLVRQAGEEEASSAVFRLHVEPAPSDLRSLPDGSKFSGSIGNPIFRLTLEKSRNPAPLSFLLEWNPHEREFFPVDEPSFARPPSEQSAHSGAQLSASANGPYRPQAMGPVLAFERAS
ncbi:ImuA family protein [Rhizobium sp. YAF28]|uniref:ImuA family protein n=1 Tax=Rhizobium sp. YAF28 TaxID=3233081 RepID=UPI003F956AF4